MFLKPGHTGIRGNLALLSISGNSWTVLECVILTAVSYQILFFLDIYLLFFH